MKVSGEFPTSSSNVIDFQQVVESCLPHIVSEVICIKCYRRWIAVRPVGTLLKNLECNDCGAGFVIETGEIIEDNMIP